MRALPIHPGYGNAQPKVLRGSSREKTDFKQDQRFLLLTPYFLSFSKQKNLELKGAVSFVRGQDGAGEISLI